ncbi:acid phosphatase AphA [Pasteurella sp. PK-2025]|uniref:acid phosphatase AphA n=1 Tax=unclassified Pasteurella TaxID=2621516 RepID=UPI003C74D863
MKNISKLSLSFCFAMSVLAVQAAPKEPYTHEGVNTRTLLAEQPIHWISIADIEKSLQGKAPMNVSFDIDDTALFSSPCFFYGKQKYSPESNAYLKNQDFWNEVNAGCDKYSMPKQVAIDLVKMHQERGDQVFFITGRTAGNVDGVTEIIKQYLNVKNMKPVQFMGGKEYKTKYKKTPAIIEHKISIHYGDSDDDILAAKEAGIRGIRFLRAANSSYYPFPQAGGYGEEVVINSSY